MKHIVVMSDLKAADIRPPALLSRFRQVSIAESEVFFDRSRLIDVDCPACQSPDKSAAFAQHGFSYVECASCRSVYVSPARGVRAKRPRPSCSERNVATTWPAALSSSPSTSAGLPHGVRASK